MSEQPDTHRTEFTVRCACGIEYHTSSAHIGRVLPCKCGRNITVTASAEPFAPQKRSQRKVRRRSKATTGETRRVANLNWNRKRRRSSWHAWLTEPLRHGSIPVRITTVVAWLYFAGMFVAWMMLRYGSEHSVPGTIIAYGPRWLALWPLALLVPVALFLTRGALLPLVVAAWIGLVPIMGARVSFATLFSRELPPTPDPGTFRVLTFNAQGGLGLVRTLPVLLKALAPDIVMLQECGETLWQTFQIQPGWHTARHGSLCTGSRWPIGEVDIMPREEILRMSASGFGGTGLVMRASIQTPNGSLHAVNLHLETARRGLEGMLSPEGLVPNDPFGMSRSSPMDADNLSGNALRFAGNAAVRDRESELASRWITADAAEAPVVVGGDFNLPVESTIFRQHWSQFTDAFEARGNGLGWSKREGRWLRIRIDHLLTRGNGVRPVNVALGHDFRSDHLPVIADMEWVRK